MKTSFTNISGYSSLRVFYQQLLIIAVVLAVYYPITFGDLSRVDDLSMIDATSKAHSLNLKDIFILHIRGAIYYRPVLVATFLLDKYVHQLSPPLLHIENLALHVINALLVYWLAWQLTGTWKEEKKWIPLLSAFFFGLHPIATEAVCWVSGRTDVLACSFVLLSANCIIRFNNSRAYQYLATAALAMALGFLTKEVALAFIPGAFLLAKNADYQTNATVPEESSAKQKHYLFVSLLIAGAVLFFFLLRYLSVETNDNRIAATFRFIQKDPIHVALIFFRALGFYFKKLLFPFPLNFAIVEVDPLYELPGVAVFVVILFLFLKKSKYSILFLTGAFLIVPSFIIALGQIAWTSLAERYLYLPAAFITIGSVFLIKDLRRKTTPMPVKKEIVAVIILLIMAVTTFQRSNVWKDNFRLLEDTVAKSPDFHYIRAQYAYALALRGDIQGARIQFEIANEFNRTKKRLKYGDVFFQIRYWDLPELGLADLLVRENKIPEAIAAYEKIIQASAYVSIDALNRLLYLCGAQLETGAKSRQVTLSEKIAFYSEKLYKTTEGADTFYWLGKVFLMRGEKREALNYFRKAEYKYSSDNQYKAIAQKMIARLENG